MSVAENQLKKSEVIGQARTSLSRRGLVFSLVTRVDSVLSQDRSPPQRDNDSGGHTSHADSHNGLPLKSQDLRACQQADAYIAKNRQSMLSAALKY